MKNYIQDAKSFDIYAPQNLTGGVPFSCGGFVAVPVKDANQNELVTIYTEGIFEFQILVQDKIKFGQCLFLKTDGSITTIKEKAFPIGTVLEQNSNSVKVILNKFYLLE